MTIDTRFLIQLFWIATALTWLLTGLRLRPVQTTLPLPRRSVEVGLQVVAFFLLFSSLSFGALLQRQLVPDYLPVQAAGVVLAATGNAIAIAARLYLGGSWSGSAVIRESHELVSSGLYGVVRHPIYTGLALAACGTALAFGEVRDLIAVPMLLTAFRLKQLSEERMLVQNFGTRYLDYRSVVRWAIVPYVL